MLGTTTQVVARAFASSPGLRLFPQDRRLVGQPAQVLERATLCIAGTPTAMLRLRFPDGTTRAWPEARTTTIDKG